MVRQRQFKSIDSEYQFFREIKGFEIEYKIEHSLYNRRKRKLLVGDKGYLYETIQLDLFNDVYIKLETPKRINQKDYKPRFYPYKKYRKRIETLFSQLCDQFMIRRNYAKLLKVLKLEYWLKLQR